MTEYSRGDLKNMVLHFDRIRAEETTYNVYGDECKTGYKRYSCEKLEPDCWYVEYSDCDGEDGEQWFDHFGDDDLVQALLELNNPEIEYE